LCGAGFSHGKALWFFGLFFVENNSTKPQGLFNAYVKLFLIFQQVVSL
jgi:hypothetical protein